MSSYYPPTSLSLQRGETRNTLPRGMLITSEESPVRYSAPRCSHTHTRAHTIYTSLDRNELRSGAKKETSAIAGLLNYPQGNGIYYGAGELIQKVRYGFVEVGSRRHAAEYTANFFNSQRAIYARNRSSVSFAYPFADFPSLAG